MLTALFALTPRKKFTLPSPAIIFRIPAADPIEGIKFPMEQNELSRKDWESYIGGHGRRLRLTAHSPGNSD